ncbi:MAG: S4 domain-containing protein [Thermodesulfobacteriota bacterium]
MDSASPRVRIDKWLWAARFFKTRSLASQAVSGGQVQVDGNRCKPARTVAGGEILRIRKAGIEFTVIVRGVAEQRRPASEAQLLYEETEDSIRQRQQTREEGRFLHTEAPAGRPGKRDRRLIRKFIRKD